jgi:hypothetical protein
MFSIDQKLNLHFLSNSKGNVIIYKCSISWSSQNEEKCFLVKVWDERRFNQNLLG